jgi:hypothetical protein
MAKPFEVVRERLLITAGDSGPPVIHHDKCRPNGQVCPYFRRGNEAMVAAGPSQHCGDFIRRITERLEGRVKGLTPVFPALLLTIKLVFRCFAIMSRCLAAGSNNQEAGGI